MQMGGTARSLSDLRNHGFAGDRFAVSLLRRMVTVHRFVLC